MKPEVEEATHEETGREKEYLDLLHRTQADFSNYRHRVEREREEQAKSAKADLIARLLPVLDDFSRAQEAMPPEAAESHWGEGIRLIERELLSVLAEEGVSRIAAEGQDFDPHEHEAISYEESNEYEKGKVKAILSDGYRLNGKVLRPARVAVSKGRNATKQRRDLGRTSWQRYWE